MFAGIVCGMTGGGSLRACGGIAVLGRWRGIFIHGALAWLIGCHLPCLALWQPVRKHVVVTMRVRKVVRQAVLHSHIWNGEHHTLVAVQVLTLRLILPLRLYLPLLRLLEEALPAACRHHLEGDDGRQLLTAHGDIHRGEHAWAVVLLHAGVACAHLVG